MLHAIRQRTPDAILLNLMMPGLDGFGLIVEMQKDPALMSIPIIVLTAGPVATAEREVLQNSVTRIIEKNGLDSRALVDDVHHVLSRYESGSEEVG